MSFINTIYQIIINALFPLSNEEKVVLNYSPREAYDLLPKSITPPIENTISAFAYKDPRVTKLIWHIKYKKSKRAITIGGYALTQMLDRSRLDLQNKSNLIDPVCVLIPMPITPQRRKERGFNQCELLTDEIKRLDKENRIVIINNLLLRIHNIAHQTLKDRAARLESTKGIFSINKEIMKLNNVNIKEYNNMTIEQLKKTQIVIIDDVITTGSTMREAMDTLKSAGFENVIGISLAH